MILFDKVQRRLSPRKYQVLQYLGSQCNDLVPMDPPHEDLVKNFRHAKMIVLDSDP